MPQSFQFRRTVVEREARSSGVFPLAECTELEGWVRQGKFTFVVGPGCARVGWEAPEITAHVAAAMARVHSSLADARDDDHRDFLARLAASHLIDLTLGFEEYPETEIERYLRPLRQSLTRVAGLATLRLVDGMRTWMEPVLDWDAVGTVVGPSQPGRRLLHELERVQQRLLQLDEDTRSRVDAASDGRTSVNQPWEHLRDLFGIKGVLAALTSFHSLLQQGAPLTGGHVEWLTSLLWHSFRYAAAWPPSTDELAFQLGVSWNSAIVEPPERAHATQKQTSQIQALQALQSIYDVASSSEGTGHWEDRDRLFRSLAAISIRPIEGTGGPVEDRDQAKLWGIGEAQYPLVYSSSLDQLLENAIMDAIRRARVADPKKAGNLALHLIIPVLLTHRGTNFQEVGWLYGTRIPDREPTTWRRLLDDDFQPDGPVVVKLNGDPQAHIGRAEGMDSAISVKPLVVLSEFQHLTLLLAETNMLFQWLQGRGPDEGHFILLGESVDEWSIRQRLFGQTMFPFWTDATSHASTITNGAEGRQGETPPPEVSAISINRKAHLVRHSLFAWVKVHEYEGDLRDVGNRLETLLEETS